MLLGTPTAFFFFLFSAPAAALFMKRASRGQRLCLSKVCRAARCHVSVVLPGCTPARRKAVFADAAALRRSARRSCLTKRAPLCVTPSEPVSQCCCLSCGGGGGRHRPPVHHAGFFLVLNWLQGIFALWQNQMNSNRPTQDFNHRFYYLGEYCVRALGLIPFNY